MSLLTPGGVVQETTNLLKNSAPVVTGSDNYGQNLILHSNNTGQKGTVLLDELSPSYGANSGALQVLGGVGVQHNVSTGGLFLNMPYGYSVTNIIVTQAGNYTAGVTPAGTATPFVFISPPNLSGGVQATATPIMSSGTVVGVNIVNPGTGYTVPPTIIFQDPSAGAPVTWASGAVVSTGTYVKGYQSNGRVYYYLATTGGQFTTTVPTHTSGSASNGGATLQYVGEVAQAYSSLGYSGAVFQGAIHQLGCVSTLVVTNAGSSYNTAPRIVISAPDMLGGRQAQATCTISSGTLQYITVTDPGSGYLYPPTVSFINTTTGGSGAVVYAVIGNPGEKPIVSNMTTAPVASGSAANTYYIDFGLSGQNVVLIANGSASTIYFDNIQNSTPYAKGFPQGRRIIVYLKNTAGSNTTYTFSNLTAANSSNGTNALTVSSTRTAKAEFIVLGTGNSASDVYCTFTAQ
jgi:hypothetical protein